MQYNKVYNTDFKLETPKHCRVQLPRQAASVSDRQTDGAINS